jgi:O-antigen ligase
VLALFFLGISLKTIINKSEVGNRIENENLENDARTLVSAIALSYGMESPLFGIGPGHIEYRLEMISHNSFTEIFAETGFIGLIIYLTILLYGLYVQIYRFKKTRDYIFVYFAVFLFFYILDNNFYVFYSWYLLFAIFFLAVTHSDNYYKKFYINNKNSFLYFE